MKREFSNIRRGTEVTQIHAIEWESGGADPCGYAVMSWYGRIYRPI